MKDLIEINDNIGRNIEYSIDFFKYTDYEMSINKPTMMESGSWLLFLRFTDHLNLPLLGITSFTKTQKIFFRNNSLFDKIVVELDTSLDNNIVEFIAKKTKYDDIILDDMKTLGCVIWKDYIDDNGYQQKERMYVGRPSINTYTDSKLSLTIEQLNKILVGSDFVKKVSKSPTGSSYNYITLKQAFSNIYNIPHNVIDKKSFPGTPFRLNEETYVPQSSVDIVLTDGFLDGKEIYAEDTVGNTSKYIHTQFYYDAIKPHCGILFTEYDEDNNPIKSETLDVLEWDIWGNSQDAYNSMNDFYIRDIIFNYQRYFRPFKVVYAGSEETQALSDGNYRIRRDFELNFTPDNELRTDFYEPTVNSGWWNQVEIKEDDTNNICEAGDRLIYFEVCGDVRPFGSASANILYDHHANIYVYNMDKKVVYWNHIASLVETVPLPKQWLKMRSFIKTEKIYYASRLNYESNGEGGFISLIKPFCDVTSNNEGLHTRVFQVSGHSYKANQQSNGLYGNYVANKSHSMLYFGVRDLDNATDKSYVEAQLDYITENMKPKAVRISDDCTRITFVRNHVYPENQWLDEWTPSLSTHEGYNNLVQFPLYMNVDSKRIYNTEDGTTRPNEKEYDFRQYYDFGGENSRNQVINEVCEKVYENTMILTHYVSYEYDTPMVDNDTKIRVVVDNFDQSPEYEMVIPQSNVNFIRDGSDFYSCTENRILKNLTSFKYYDTSWKVLDYNPSNDRAIIQTPTELLYYDVENDVTLFNKSIIGFTWILPMTRERFLFTNPLENKSDELIRIGSVTIEPVRLLSFTGNRYLAGDRLAASFVKNSYYDGDGVLNIGFTGDKYELTDYSVISNSIKKYKYDSIEIVMSDIKKNDFKQTSTEDADNLEEDENSYDEAISITMTSNKDIQMDITVTRTGENTLYWEASNEFSIGEGEVDSVTGIAKNYISGEETITGFNYFTIPLTGIYDGIIITCDFYNTELAQGDKFRGTVTRREYTDSIFPLTIVDVNEQFPFLDDNILDLKFPFFYAKYLEEFQIEMNDYFTYNDDYLREFVEFTIEVPTLLFFDTNYNNFEIGNIITLVSDSKYVNGYSLDNGVITAYNENKCDYYIEQMIYNMKKGTTKLKLISV